MQSPIIPVADAPTDLANLRLVRQIGTTQVSIPAAPLGLLGNDVGTAVAGDMIYGSAAGTWARLAKGTALQHMRMNAGATAPEWSSYPTIETLEGLTLVAGDMLYATGADTLAKLAKGTALQVLRQNTALTAPEWATAREVLTANRTYYVRTDGSNSNTGLVDSAGGAFLTIQKAIDVVAGTLDLAGFTVTVQVRDGTYAAQNTLKEVVGYSAPGCLIIQGNNGTPANVVISATSAHCFLANNINSCWDIKDLKVQTTTAGSCLYAINSKIRWGNLDFGATATAHIIAQDGALATCLSSYTISSGGGLHWSADAGGIIRCQAVTVTLTGTPAFSNQFANSRSSAQIICNANTFSGAATGTRYSAANGGLINTSGGGATYLPGNAAGAGTNFGVSPWGLYV